MGNWGDFTLLIEDITANITGRVPPRYKWSDMSSPYTWPEING